MTQNSENGERIAKRLARAGVASRREVERMIDQGRVFLNGTLLTTPAVKVGDSDKIEVDGRLIGDAQATKVWRYHKPLGLVTSNSDEKGRRTVFDDLPEDLPRVMTVGRLDINSEGLLLLTNDGELKRKLELPSTGWVRKYRVRVKGTVLESRFAPLREGITVDGERFQPMKVTVDREERQMGANAWVTVALREGKNREIRRAMETLGLSVNRLIRVSYGPFQLGDLRAGAVEEIRGKILHDQLGITSQEEVAAPKPNSRTQKRRKAAMDPSKSLRPRGKPKAR